ncbi:MAG: cytochrome P460 family protein [Gammaproteobacteria bacterium]
MNYKTISSGLIGATLLLSATELCAETAKSGKAVYGEYRDWPILGVSHRTEKNSMRAIVGNDVAIKAARSGNTNPWPDGTIIGKITWKERPHPKWPSAIVPGEFTGAEAMVKDSKKFKETAGWGFARWEGDKLVMNDKEKSDTCFACHTTAKDSDYMFTIPVLR